MSTVIHQHLVLQCDLLEERLHGTTEIEIKRDGDEWPTALRLHSRQTELLKVEVDGIVCSFEHADYQRNPVIGPPSDLNVFFANYADGLIASKDGELRIDWPASSAGSRLVKVYFQLTKPKGALTFANCNVADKQECEAAGYKVIQGDKEVYAHMFTYSSLCGGDSVGAGTGARCWFPCLDTLQSRCPFTIQVDVPEGLMAISVGELESTLTVELENGSPYTRYSYKHHSPVAPHNIGLCIGPFIRVKSDTEVGKAVQLFHLPSVKCRQALSQSLNQLRRAVKEICEYLRLSVFPVDGTYKQVFVEPDMVFANDVPFATMSVLSSSLLGSKREVSVHSEAGAGLLFGSWYNDPFSRTNLDKPLYFIQARCLAYSIFGCLVPARSEADVWVPIGICGYLALRYSKGAWKVPERKFEDEICKGFLDPDELLAMNFERMQNAKTLADKVNVFHGLAGNVLQRTLQRPPEIALTVDSVLWTARGFEFESLFADRAFFLIHMFESIQAGNNNQGTSNDDAFANLLSTFARQSLLADRTEEYEESYKADLERADSIDSLVPSLLRSQSISESAVGIGDIAQKMIDENMNLVGIGTDNLVQALIRTGSFKPAQFQVSRDAGGRNIADDWMRRVSFVNLKCYAEYKGSKTSGESNTVDVRVEQKSTPPLDFKLVIQVSESDGSFDCDKHVQSKDRTSQFQISLSTQKIKQRGGRKSINEKDRMRKWDHMNELDCELIHTLLREEGENAIWSNELPLKYVSIDPFYFWMRTIHLRQTEIMYLELLKDAAISRKVLPLCSALADMSMLRNIEGRDPANNTHGIAWNIGSKDAFLYELRCASAISGVIADFTRPPRVRAEALIRLAQWQSRHEPDKAAPDDPVYKHSIGKPLGKRPGGHPWVGLTLMLLAMKTLFFNPETEKLMPNDFGVPGEYGIKRAFANSIHFMRAKSGKPPDELMEMVATLLRDNDNSTNPYSDSEYISDLVVGAAQAVASYVAGTRVERSVNNDDNEEDVQSESVHAVLGHFYNIVEDIQRILSYDAIEPSREHRVTAGCLQAMAILESAGVLTTKTPFFAYAVKTNESSTMHITGIHWGPVVRQAAFSAVIYVYLFRETHVERNRDGAKVGRRKFNFSSWLQVLLWLLEALNEEKSPMVKWNVIKYMLKLHSRTITKKQPELENNISHSGLFWPLSNPRSDLFAAEITPAKEIAAAMWTLFNSSNAYDSRMRLGVAQLWRAIWKLESPPVLKDVASSMTSGSRHFKNWSILSSGVDDDDHIAPVKRKFMSNKGPSVKVRVKF